MNTSQHPATGDNAPQSRPRIAPIQPPYSEEVQASFDKLMPPGMDPIALFRTVAHNPRVLRRMQRGGLLDAGSIPVRAREIMILRTTARCDAEYEWGVHVAFFARTAELSEHEATATVTGQASDWADAADAAVIRLADALHDHATVGDELWAELTRHWDDAQLLELIMLAGLYHAVSFICTAARVAPEPGTPRFPQVAPM